MWMDPGVTEGEFTESMVGLLLQDEHRRIQSYMRLQSSPRIAAGRCTMFREWLKPDTVLAGSWALLVDSDMVFDADLLDRLFKLADPVKAPIVGGLCFSGTQHEMRPTLYMARTLAVDSQQTIQLDRLEDFPADTVIDVDATGAACLLVHRSVVEAMARPFPKGYGTIPIAEGGAKPNPFPWFQEGLTNPQGEEFGEDTAFCIRARIMGFPIKVHTGIDVGHKKSLILNLQRWREYRGADAAAAQQEGFSWQSGSPSAI